MQHDALGRFVQSLDVTKARLLRPRNVYYVDIRVRAGRDERGAVINFHEASRQSNASFRENDDGLPGFHQFDDLLHRHGVVGGHC